jgi:hypothetical protein
MYRVVQKYVFFLVLQNEICVKSERQKVRKSGLTFLSFRLRTYSLFLAFGLPDFQTSGLLQT